MATIKQVLEDLGTGKLPAVTAKHSTRQHAIVPGSRVRYLAEITESLLAPPVPAALVAAPVVSA